MTNTTIFWPMIAQALLAYIAYSVLAVRRYGSVRGGAARASQFKARATEPEISVTAANNVANQFELPVLFHVVCLSLFLTNGVNTITLVIAWLFVLSRYAHAWVHMTSNRIAYRSRAFQIGAVMVALLWLWLALNLAGLV